MPTVKVKGQPDLRRSNTCSGVIININQEGFNEFTRVRDQQEKRDRKQSELEQRLDKMNELLVAGGLSNEHLE